MVFGRNKDYSSSYGQSNNYKFNKPLHWIFRILNILLFCFFVLVVVNYTLGVVLGPFNRVENVIYSSTFLTYVTPEKYTWYIWWFIILFQLFGVIYTFIPYGYGSAYPKNTVVNTLGYAQWLAWATIILWFILYPRIEQPGKGRAFAIICMVMIAVAWFTYFCVLVAMDVLKIHQVRVTPPNYIAYYLPTEVACGWLSVMVVVTLVTLIEVVLGPKMAQKLPDMGINKKKPTLENLSIGLIAAEAAIAVIMVNAGHNIGYGGAVIWGLVGQYFTNKDYAFPNRSMNGRRVNNVQITCIVGFAVIGASIISTFILSARIFRKYVQLYGSKGSVNKGVLNDDPYTGRQQFVASSDYV